MKKMLSIGAAALAVILPQSSAISQEPADTPLVLHVTAFDGERILGTPRLSVRAGKQAGVGFEHADGTRFDGRFTVEPLGGRKYRVSMELEFDSSRSGAHRMKPVVTVIEAEKAAVRAGDVDGALVGVDLTVEAV